MTNLEKKIYKEKGFIVLRNIIEKKFISEIKKEISSKIKNKNIFKYYERINNKQRLRRIEKVSDNFELSHKILKSKKILDLLKKLTNKNYVLFKDKLNFKYPGGSGFLPHIDGHFYWIDRNNKKQNGWNKYSSNFINLVIPLERSTKENGCLYLAEKKNTNVLGKSFKDITNNLITNSPNIKNKNLKYFNFKPIEMNQGDILFFDWKCAHMSKKNISNKSRKIFYATYCFHIGKDNLRKKYYYDKLNSKNDLKNKSLQF
tara:strand:- start:154 stop:930 length:777 start_codon:yes stop_codon:yes gene_type:complete